MSNNKENRLSSIDERIGSIIYTMDKIREIPETNVWQSITKNISMEMENVSLN